MAGSINSLLDLIEASQSQKEVTANALFDAASPAMLYARRARTSAGLTWGYYGGALLIGGSIVSIPNGTLTLGASIGNWIEADPATGAISLNHTGFTAGRIPLYLVLTDSTSIIGYEDLRSAYSAASAAAGDSLAAHVAASDPHPQYLTQAEGDGRYDATGAATAAVSAHAAASDPHPQYLTQTEGDARYAAVAGAVSDGDKGDIVVSGSGATWAIDSGVLSTFARTLIDDADAATARATLGLGTAATLASDVDGTLAANSDAKVPTQKAVKTYVAAAVAAGGGAQPFDLTAFYPGTVPASALVTRVPVARVVTFAAALAGSVGKARVAATAQTDFDVQKNGASVGTIRFAAAATSATFIAASGFSTAAGDVLSIVAPATADSTLADVGFVLTGTR